LYSPSGTRPRSLGAAGDVRVEEKAVLVGTAVAQARRHSRDGVPPLIVRPAVEEAGDAAHGSRIPQPAPRARALMRGTRNRHGRTIVPSLSRFVLAYHPA